VTEQDQALGHRELTLGAELVDGLAFDVLHDKVRSAILGRSSIEELRDIGMLQGRQDLALATEVPDEIPSGGIGNELDRHPLPVLIVVSEREVDRSHTSCTELLDETVGADSALGAWTPGNRAVFRAG
jgi:hypothetical protein